MRIFACSKSFKTAAMRRAFPEVALAGWEQEGVQGAVTVRM
jgi:hypothetical protein